MNTRRAALEERFSRHAIWLGAGLASVGLAVVLGRGAGQSSGKAQVFFAVEQSTNHLGRGAALSPDGSTLVYVGEDDGLYAASVGTGQKQLLLRQTRPGLDVFGAPAFSPDGSRIIFVASGGTYYYASDIYSVHLDGSGLTKLTHSEFISAEQRPADAGQAQYAQYFSGPQLAPDGSKILLGVDDTHTLTDYAAVMNPDGSSLKLLVKGEPLFWGADSQSIYCDGPDGQVQKLELPSGTNEPVQGLTASRVDDLQRMAPSILGKLPDKDWFVVAAPDTGNISLMSVQHGAATSQASLGIPLSESTPKGPLFLVSVQWTPSGRVLLVYRGDEHGWMISEPTVNVERFEVAQATY